MAQVEVPAPSPFSKVEQKVGLTDVTVEYSRPGAKNRRVFGKLVPFGEMWRTGANASTKVTFSEDVQVEGQRVEKRHICALYNSRRRRMGNHPLQRHHTLGGSI